MNDLPDSSTILTVAKVSGTGNRPVPAVFPIWIKVRSAIVLMRPEITMVPTDSSGVKSYGARQDPIKTVRKAPKNILFQKADIVFTAIASEFKVVRDRRQCGAKH